ncbi:hypothetical protein [Saccharomonospora saliphila]|uniref:hypothetical protein n=1 Tax=Saccharomonospora saliphila TaxID=369829 RepID=UPI00036E7466|nr:hypothetical protein [Saccharomonospora saliphila]
MTDEISGVSGELQDRTTLLDGIDDELLDAANQALDACDLLKGDGFSELWWHESIEEAKPRVMRPFKVLSGHDVQGMTELIDGYESVLARFTPNMAADDPEELPELRRAYDLLDGTWEGQGAEAATLYVAKLQQAFQGSALLISELAGGVISAREAIATARQDLVELADSFHRSAEQFRESEESSSPAWGRMLAWATAGVVVGLVTGGLGGVVAATGGMAGSLIAGEVAKADAGTVGGSNPGEVIQSFTDTADELLRSTTDTAEKVAAEINKRIDKMSNHPVPPPPDVSPGPSFDPGDFRTDQLPGDIADAVRDADVDIDRQGEVRPGDEETRGEITARLDGELPAPDASDDVRP